MSLLEPFTIRTPRGFRQVYRARRNGNILRSTGSGKPRTYASVGTAQRFLGRDWPDEAITTTEQPWHTGKA